MCFTETNPFLYCLSSRLSLKLLRVKSGKACFLFNLRFLVSLTTVLPPPPFEAELGSACAVEGRTLVAVDGGGRSGLFGIWVIASPLDLMLMTALVMTTSPDDLGGSSLWLLVSESAGRNETAD